MAIEDKWWETNSYRKLGALYVVASIRLEVPTPVCTSLPPFRSIGRFSTRDAFPGWKGTVWDDTTMYALWSTRVERLPGILICRRISRAPRGMRPGELLAFLSTTAIGDAPRKHTCDACRDIAAARSFGNASVALFHERRRGKRAYGDMNNVAGVMAVGVIERMETLLPLDNITDEHRMRAAEANIAILPVPRDDVPDHYEYNWKVPLQLRSQAMLKRAQARIAITSPVMADATGPNASDGEGL